MPDQPKTVEPPAPEPLRVLLVEDSDDDAVLVERALRQGGFVPDITRVEDGPAMRAALAERLFDTVISDFSLPTFSASAALQLITELGLDIAFIVVSGTVGEEAAVNAMRAGAHDFVVKTNLARLAPAIRRETMEARRRSEYAHTRHALSHTSALLEAVFDSSPTAIFMTDDAGAIEVWNPAAEQIFDAPAASVLGRRMDAAAFGGGELFEELAYQIGTGESVRGRELDWQIRGRAAALRLSVSAAPIFGAEGQPRGIVWVVLDASEQHRLHQQLLHSQRLEAVGRLAGGIAHDFNNILTAITGYTDFLLDGLPTVLEELRSDVIEIRTAAQRAARLTSQLLTFSRRQSLEHQALDLNAVVRDVESMLRRVMGDQVFLDAQLEPVLPAVWGDRGQIEQILMNLVVNARDAIDTGGTVRIRTAPATGEDAPPAAEPGVDYVLLEVTDDGSGMAPELIERIFDPFFTTKEPGKGTGLGLSTVYGIVQQSGGLLDVQSMPGAGTRFRIWLRHPPAARASRARSEQDAVRRPVTQPRVSILIVEDEPAVRAVAARTLERFGHRVRQAGSGYEALRLAEAVRPDLVLSDVVMAGMSGPEMVRRLRARHPDLPVIFMSGYAEEHIPDGAALRQGEHFLAKPFTPDALLQAVERIVTRDADG
jgi:PAS domain S-box-containing protein